MKFAIGSCAVLAVMCAGTAFGQAENPDLRIRAKFRTPSNGLWGANESVGGPDFRVHSRFLAVYYGGVRRLDDFKFSVSLDFTAISGFATNFPTSMYNTNYDVYIDNEFVGRLIMNNEGLGLGSLTYDSRHADLPDLPLPANFPDPVDIGDIVRMFAAGATLPEIGDPLPGGTPIFAGALVEQFKRGDANNDGHVDLLDFAFLSSSYDPFHLQGLHIGPAAGDFTGDNLTDQADYDIFIRNWTPSSNPPAEPPPIARPACDPDVNQDGNADQDDVAYLINVIGGGSNTTAIDPDYNHDGNVDQDDVAALVNSLAGGGCP